MCILNSFENDGNIMRIPNIIVNGISALLLSTQSNLQVNEKCELFKSLSNNFLLLAHQIEGYEATEVNNEIVKNLVDKYDTLMGQVSWEDIPKWYKVEIKTLWEEEGKCLPLTLNGLSGIVTRRKDSSMGVNL